MSKERRSLVEGLKATPELQEIEEAFVFGSKRPAESTMTPLATPMEPSPVENVVNVPEQRILPQMTGRIPVTTRCRPEVASALKRASLQRQLAGIEPYYVQDIMEEALDTWLRQNGYV